MFNSRDPQYRNPMGAVKEGTVVHFRISPPRNLSCSAAFLIIEQDSHQNFVHNMFWCGMNGDNNEWWECDFTPSSQGLYFYHFELKTSRGHNQLYKGVGGQIISGSYGNRWQLTVYDKAFTTPDWLAGGIIYQIFPDRFCFSGKEKSGVPTDRILRSDWGETPEWEPTSDGEITNSDYFKGDFAGIQSKLYYLKSLGITCIYLNPIFEAHSNHRYNTADYSIVDPLLGDNEDFSLLCDAAEELGIHVILDGVFSHTGSDSVYFNKEERYDTKGAYNSITSPYYPWYNFKKWPTEYESWWNFDTLPNVVENNPEYSEYINGEQGIIRNWISAGANGWRLDVADELPDTFLDSLRIAAKTENPNAIIMGEVWEDASNKTAYGIRRRYLLGNQLDTVMNYPFREAILSFLTGGHSSLCMEQIEDVVENYPPQSVRLLMNHIGTHDTERAITVLAGKPCGGMNRAWQNETHLTPEEYEIGVSKLQLASLLQFTLPGVPCVYYGDEAGLEGYKDPFNRGCYPWGKENQHLIHWYKTLASLRSKSGIFKEGSLRNIYSHNSILSFERFETRKNGDEDIIFVAVNRSDSNANIPVVYKNVRHLLGTAYTHEFKLPPYGFAVFALTRKKSEVAFTNIAEKELLITNLKSIN